MALLNGYPYVNSRQIIEKGMNFMSFYYVQLVKVQIRENITEKSSEKSSLTAKMGAQQQSELAVTHIQPCQKKQLTKLEVKNRTIFFPETKSGEHSGKF